MQIKVKIVDAPNPTEVYEFTSFLDLALFARTKMFDPETLDEESSHVTTGTTYPEVNKPTILQRMCKHFTKALTIVY